MLPDEISALPLELEKMFYELQDRIMTDVVRRLRKTGEITSTADYQLNKYLILGGTTEEIEAEIKRLTGMTDAEVWEVYDRVVEKDYTRFKNVYEQVNGEFLQYEDNPELQGWVTAAVEQTQGEIRNITQSMGFTVDMGGGKKAFTPLSMYYQKYLDRACLDVVTGSFDYGSVLRRVTKEMAASGLQSVPYASGHVSNAIVAARRALLTGVNQLSAKINDKVGKELDADHFEVTAHAGARPSHAAWQGRVYTRKQLESVCGLGSVTGLCGANCRHAYYAFIPGVSQRAYTDEYLEKLEKEDAITRTWNGREYNAYERTQKQRQYESDMRKQRAYIKALKVGHADPKDIQAAQARYTNSLHEYKTFCKKMGLKEQMERVYVDGLGRMTGGRVPNKTLMTEYKGIPKTWMKDYELASKLQNKVNPQQYNDNCAACVVAYEMCKKGYPVEASGYIRALARAPWKAWEGVEPVRLEDSTAIDIVNALMASEETIRLNLSGVWKFSQKGIYSTGEEGHVLSVEKVNNNIIFIDPQTGKEYNNTILKRLTSLQYWRVDNAELSDKGVSACICRKKR